MPAARAPAAPAAAAPNQPACQASALPGRQWNLWLRHILAECGPTLYVLVLLTQILCLRVTQAARLRGADFHWGPRRVWVGKFKRHRGVHKPLTKEAKKTLKGLRDKVVKGAARTVRNGARAATTVTPAWKWPADGGHLFPSLRSDAALPHVSKDWICKQLKEASATFVAKYGARYPNLLEEAPRSHSGRRNSITRLVESGVPERLGMEFAQLSNPRVYQRYAAVTSGCVLDALERASRRAPRQATPGVFLFLGAYIPLGLAISRRPRNPKTKIRNVVHRRPGPEHPNWCWDRPAMNLNREQKPIIA